LKNGTLRRFLLFLMFSNVGFSPVWTALMPKMQKSGFKKESIAQLGLIQQILSITLALYVAEILLKEGKKNQFKELTYQWQTLVWQIFTYCVSYLIFRQFVAYGNLTWTMVFLVANGLFDTYAGTKWFVSYETFVARIAHKRFPGTFMTAFNSIANLSNEWHKPLILYSMEYIPYLVLVIAGLIYTSTYLYCTRAWLMQKEKEPDAWVVHLEGDEEEEIEMEEIEDPAEGLNEQNMQFETE